MDRASTYRIDNPLPRRREHVQWKTHPVLLWLEIAEPTPENLYTVIDSHLIRGVGYRHLVDATRYGSRLLLDSPNDPLPLFEIIVVYDDTQICRWWGQCLPNDPRDFLFRRHCSRESEPGTLAPFGYQYPGWDNRDDPNTVASAERETGSETGLETELVTDHGNGNYGEPESSATAAKRGSTGQPTPHVQ